MVLIFFQPSIFLGFVVRKNIFTIFRFFLSYIKKLFFNLFEFLWITNTIKKKNCGELSNVKEKQKIVLTLKFLNIKLYRSEIGHLGH